MRALIVPAACILDEGVLSFSPSVCPLPSCPGPVGVQHTVGWSCTSPATAVTSLFYENIGLISADTCQAVGTTKTKGWWSPKGTSGNPSPAPTGALCCTNNP